MRPNGASGAAGDPAPLIVLGIGILFSFVRHGAYFPVSVAAIIIAVGSHAQPRQVGPAPTERYPYGYDNIPDNTNKPGIRATTTRPVGALGTQHGARHPPVGDRRGLRGDRADGAGRGAPAARQRWEDVIIGHTARSTWTCRPTAARVPASLRCERGALARPSGPGLSPASPEPPFREPPRCPATGSNGAATTTCARCAAARRRPGEDGGGVRADCWDEDSRALVDPGRNWFWESRELPDVARMRASMTASSRRCVPRAWRGSTAGLCRPAS